MPLAPFGPPLARCRFIALAERISGQDLDAFFDEWLFTPAKPPLVAGSDQTAATLDRPLDQSRR